MSPFYKTSKPKWIIIFTILLCSSLESLNWNTQVEIAEDVGLLGANVDPGGSNAGIFWIKNSVDELPLYSVSIDNGMSFSAMDQVVIGGPSDTIVSTSPFLQAGVNGSNYTLVGQKFSGTFVSIGTTDGGSSWAETNLEVYGGFNGYGKNISISNNYLSFADVDDNGVTDSFVFFFYTPFSSPGSWGFTNVSPNIFGTDSNAQSVAINGTNGLVGYALGLDTASSFFANVTTDFTGAWVGASSITGGPFDISTNKYIQTAVSPSSGTNANRALVVFLDDGTNTIYASHKPDLTAAANWTAATAIALAGANAFPQLAFSENGATAILVWNSSGAIQYRLSTDFGSSWGSQMTLSTDVRANGHPQVALSQDGSTVMVIWLSSTGISSSMSVDSGATWTVLVNPSNDTSALNPKLALYSNGLQGISTWTSSSYGNTTKIYSSYFGEPPAPSTPVFPVFTAGSPAQSGVTAYSGFIQWIVPENLKSGPQRITSIEIFRGPSSTKLSQIQLIETPPPIPVQNYSTPNQQFKFFPVIKPEPTDSYPEYYNDPNLQFGSTYHYRVVATLLDGSTYELTAQTISIN